MTSKRPDTGRLPIKRGSSSHDLLLLTASQTRVKGYATLVDAIHVLGKFKQPYMVNRTVKDLLKFGLIADVKRDDWKITSEGLRVLNELTVRRPASNWR